MMKHLEIEPMMDIEEPDLSDDDIGLLRTMTHTRGISSIVKDHATRDDFWPKLRASLIVIIGFPFGTYLLHKSFHLEMAQIIGVMVVFLHCYFMISVCRQWFTATGLFRLKARYKKVDGHARMLVPCKIVEFRDQAIKSISEFSAIRGTAPHLALFSVGLLNFGVYLPIFIQQFDEWTDEWYFNKKLAAIAIFGGPAGMTWLGIWELNPHDTCHKIMHYIGVFMGICSNIGLILALNGNWISWIVAFPGIIGFVLWTYFDYSAKMPSNDPKYVTKVSRRCLVSELMVILSSAAAFDVYMLYCIGAKKAGTGIPVWD